MAESYQFNTEETKPKKYYLLVAAFDFGTTYSGYAFSFRDDPMKVQTNQKWVSGSERLMSLKTPTCLLVKPDGEFGAFGFEAENKYVGLAYDGNHVGWRLFRHFKMMLHQNKQLSRVSNVEDIEGNSMAALQVFTMALKYLRDHLLEAINRQKIGVLETDIQYVLTVPAIWDDNAKQFMREAAIKAGIDSTRLLLALEPEVASFWCATINPEVRLALAGTGTQYMVIDLGGGTADISVHERKSDKTLKEIHRASGGPFGGIYVDDNYLKLLANIFGEQAMKEIKAKEMYDFLEILREWESKKMTCSLDADEQFIFRIPTTLRELMEQHTGQKLKDRLVSIGYGDKIKLRGSDKMRFDSDIVRFWFDEPVSKLINHVKKLLSEQAMKRVQTILLVGGFGESKYVQDRLKKEVPDRRIIVPEDAGLVVLKGAVRFGHDTNIVTTRRMRYTYGVDICHPFDKIKGDISKMIIINDKKMEQHIFFPFAIRDSEINVDDEFTHIFSPMSPIGAVFPIYRSTQVRPVHTSDEGCEMIGQLVIRQCDDRKIEETTLIVTFIIGATELMVKVRIKETGKEENIQLDCLQ